MITLFTLLTLNAYAQLPAQRTCELYDPGKQITSSEAQAQLHQNGYRLTQVEPKSRRYFLILNSPAESDRHSNRTGCHGESYIYTTNLSLRYTNSTTKRNLDRNTTNDIECLESPPADKIVSRQRAIERAVKNIINCENAWKKLIDLNEKIED